MRFGTIGEIWRYPVSSLTGERLPEADLVAAGVDGDRLWGLFDAPNLSVAAPESEKRWRPVPGLSARRRDGVVEVSGDGAVWHPLPSDAADSLASGHLGFPVRFAPFEAAAEPRYERAPLHMLTTASLAALQTRLPAANLGTPRFRPNLVIETGADVEGYAEQALIGRRMTIGTAVIEVSEPCERCAFTALGQPGLPFDKDVLHAISREGGGFGVLARVVQPGRVALGDAAIVK